MINKKTKSFGVVLLSILMIFSLVIFTACEPLDPADPPANIYTKENAITVLTNAITALNQEPLPLAASVEVKSTGMTEYKGIDGWELNSVDFKQEDNHDASHYGKTTAVMINTFKMLLDKNLININDYYVVFKYDYDHTSNQDYVYSKIKFEGNKMVLFQRIYLDNGDIKQSPYRCLITFNDELQVQNVIYERISDDGNPGGYKKGVYYVDYFANNSCYCYYGSYDADDVDSESQPKKGLIQSLRAESTAGFKPTIEIVDLKQVLEEQESQPQV